jgi:hypothetical protein
MEDGAVYFEGSDAEGCPFHVLKYTIIWYNMPL